jgi:ABC-type sugar transport system permease subunit
MPSARQRSGGWHPRQMTVFERNRKLVIPFLAPALLFYLLFFVYPAIRGFYYSALDWSGFTEHAVFIGLANFVELVGDVWFWRSLAKTFAILFIGGLAIFALAFLFIMLIGSGVRGKNVFRAIIFLPNVIPPVAITILWGFIYNQRFGIINGFLRAIGLKSLARPWMAPDYIFWSMLVMIVWTYVGFYVVILLSGVAKIPADLYEGATLEGASPRQMFFSITVPLIWDVLAVAAIYWGIFSLKMFELIYSFSGFLPNENIWTTSVYVYILGFGKINPIYRLGYSTAIAVVLLVLTMSFVVISRRLMNRERVEY